MDPADEIVGPTDRQSVSAAANSDDKIDDLLPVVFKEFQLTGDQSKPAEDLHGFDGKLNKQSMSPEDFELFSAISHHLGHEASERKAIYDRLVAIENKIEKGGSRRFGRYLFAILIGVAATLAWQPYSDSAKQIIATRASELGWSPEAKQMIATSIQWIGWTKAPTPYPN